MKYDLYRPHSRVTFKNELLDLATGEVTYPPSMTKQSFAAECDINNILKQYKTSGMLAHVNAKAAQGQYLDLPAEVDFQTALNTVMRAEDAFASLPSKLRTRFGNDPAEFLVFCADPANAEEMRTLGLANPLPPPPLPGDGPGSGSSPGKPAQEGPPDAQSGVQG